MEAIGVAILAALQFLASPASKDQGCNKVSAYSQGGKMILDIETLEGAKEALIWLYVLSTIGVIVGVYLEGERFSEPTKLLGWRLLLWSLSAETLFGILIFAADGRISRIQRDDIIALETKLAPRILSNQQSAAVAHGLKSFGGQEFTVASFGGEAFSLASRITEVLKKADWKYFEPEMQLLPMAGTIGIQVWVHPDSGRITKAAEALVEELNGKSIEAALLKHHPQSPKDNRIEVIVGSKF
jgi:hypothetical protein